MSEPRHIWLIHLADPNEAITCSANQPGAFRAVRTDSDEYRALIERVVHALASILRKAQGVRDPETGIEIDVGGECLTLRALYDWLEGTP